MTLSLNVSNWSGTSFVSMPLTNFPNGYAYVTLFVNGMPSSSVLVNVSPQVTPGPITLGNPIKLGNSIQFSFSNTPGAQFTALAATSVTVPLSNWTVLGAVTDVSSGQFQFTDSNTGRFAQRFYRVSSP